MVHYWRGQRAGRGWCVVGDGVTVRCTRGLVHTTRFAHNMLGLLTELFASCARVAAPLCSLEIALEAGEGGVRERGPRADCGLGLHN